MEVAKLFDHNVSIAQEWFEQIEIGLSQENVSSMLDNKYRIHSSKKRFVCLCCSQPVTMVLRGDSPHFRHQGDPCPSAENYERYTKRTKSSESNSHRAGRAILRTYLEGQMKPRAVEVLDGYMFRSKLKIVPDFILNFPDGTIWSVDYVTGSRVDESYHNYIQKRTETYKSAGFKPFYFIDKSWLADVPNRSVISLYKAEDQMKVQSDTDIEWTAFIQEFINVFGKEFVLRECFGVQSNFGGRDTHETFEVYSLAYVDTGAGKAYIQRFIPVLQKKFGYHVYRSSISLERATSLDQNEQRFTWWELGENEAMLEQLQALSTKYESELAMESEIERQKEIHRQKMEDQERFELLRRQSLKEQAAQEGLKRQTIYKKAQGVSTPGKSETHFDLMPSIINDDIGELIRENMSVSQAFQILSNVKANKRRLTSDRLNLIRNQARVVMGPMKNRSSISEELRSVMIDLATV